jgi:protocatechuate 3,4-dioxygenase, alpha subunit
MSAPDGISTPSQTVGPFFAVGMPPVDGVGSGWLRGRVLDGAGEPVPDAVVEAWQDDPAAFGRAATDADGRWAVRVHQRYVDLSVFARGLLNRVVTRVYFADDPADPVLAAVDPARRGTLIAATADDGYTFDIHLQGPHETVFFAF